MHALASTHEGMGQRDEDARLLAALESDGKLAASRGGRDRSGIRCSAHFYNTAAEVERVAAANLMYVRTGV